MHVVQLTVFAALAQLSAASYELVDSYTPSNFFDKFDFFSTRDPSNGYVSYQDRDTSFRDNLVRQGQNSVRIGVDSWSIASGSGRRSVRLVSKAKYLHGLILADIKHMPTSTCGLWPAFWTVGDVWPRDGELDIIEGVNQQSMNKMAMHTTEGCKINVAGDFTGIVETRDCNVYSPNQAFNQGCLVSSTQANSYGTNFNNINGGVYAIQWTSAHISIWFFPRGNIPSDMTSQNPDPTKWGRPGARFSGECDMDRFMKQQRLIFNTNFCGDWAGGVWNSDPVCSTRGSCDSYVRNNPNDFSDAYWEVNGLRVFRQVQPPQVSAIPEPTPAPTPTPTPTSTPTPATRSSETSATSSTTIIPPVENTPTAAPTTTRTTTTTPSSSAISSSSSQSMPSPQPTEKSTEITSSTSSSSSLNQQSTISTNPISTSDTRTTSPVGNRPTGPSSGTNSSATQPLVTSPSPDPQSTTSAKPINTSTGTDSDAISCDVSISIGTVELTIGPVTQTTTPINHMPTGASTGTNSSATSTSNDFSMPCDGSNCHSQQSSSSSTSGVSLAASSQSLRAPAPSIRSSIPAENTEIPDTATQTNCTTYTTFETIKIVKTYVDAAQTGP
ncbi:hypothetical protein LOZ61_004341 [Ophidiomyces ophidiicola]|uniref:Uncharacterized protein n=1 Tax=Ophidiomyces ophidiicola TaxID=1387563 RepID=A0ACB8V2Q7_9EURO|nr:uncharacterized protein LOZ57_006146 [Ophidiomyces ophidiicola]KAI1910593.1 hypothetical protein LOZ61_004341 [Ophidiomyces ophidiicola]KAI1916322.1 hypothetical protein LOZ64_003361 [Ophidiomyces ophidiicola]KAI1930683.1 hypothetical protein LOZ60_000659 [Ophidiomyces ophidiicola]KAI1939702.1 hypothetical protein LOZ57_006146 [Ophidiomyces ophidiicola]KAI1955428.1 hypothetical protein LOZ59_004566 [Ophidiomyces ophidiicola]